VRSCKTSSFPSFMYWLPADWKACLPSEPRASQIRALRWRGCGLVHVLGSGVSGAELCVEQLHGTQLRQRHDEKGKHGWMPPSNGRRHDIKRSAVRIGLGRSQVVVAHNAGGAGVAGVVALRGFFEGESCQRKPPSTSRGQGLRL
jgi:hypothetical protein